MARNESPVIACKVCGKPATKVAPGYFYAAGAYCDACAKEDDEYEVEEMLPLVNSPRAGVCGYTGDDIDWEEIEDEDEEMEEQ